MKASTSALADEAQRRIDEGWADDDLEDSLSDLNSAAADINDAVIDFFATLDMLTRITQYNEVEIDAGFSAPSSAGHFEEKFDYTFDTKLKLDTFLHIAVAKKDIPEIEKQLSEGADLHAIGSDRLQAGREG